MLKYTQVSYILIRVFSKAGVTLEKTKPMKFHNFGVLDFHGDSRGIYKVTYGKNDKEWPGLPLNYPKDMYGRIHNRILK